MTATPGRRTTALVAIAITAAILAPRTATADETCSNDQREWAARCSRVVGIDVRAARCPASIIVVEARSGERAPLEVEITSGGGGLRGVDGYGLSPVGEFVDWAAEPAHHRAALDAVARCVVDEKPPMAAPLDRDSIAGMNATVARAPVVPWLFLLALVGLGVLAASARPRIRTRRGLELAGFGAAVFALHAIVLPFAFFHQNGQGALWVEYALRGHGGLADYGPGYREMFSAVAAGFPAYPDTAVFIAQAALAALVPPLVWIIARRIGARPAVCWSIAGVVAIDPTLGRIAQSESYFAVLVVLLTLAGAAAIEATHRASLRAWRPWVGIVAAGLLVAQAARVHPLCWLPAALLPLAVFVMPAANWRARALRAGAVAVGIAAIVAATSATVMMDVLGSEVVPHRLGSRLSAPSSIVVAGVAGVLALGVWRLERSVRGLSALVIGAAVVMMMRATNALPYDLDAFWHAVVRLYLPVLVACAAGLAGQVEMRAVAARRVSAIVAISVAVVGLVHAAVQWNALTLRATDVRESQWVRTWRADIPAGTRVLYLARAGDRTYALPIYLRADGLVPIGVSVSSLGSVGLPIGSLYYRSSLCSTPEGEAACRELDSRCQLVAIEPHTLPAIASQPWAPGEQPASVGLFRVVAESDGAGR